MSAHLFAKADRQRVRISSRFGERIHPVTGKRQFHNGTDFAIPEGTPVHSPWDGLILNVASDDLNGNYLRVRHGTDVVTVYCHLSAFAPDIDRDKVVAEGELLGYVGTTGRSTGPHLHFGTMIRGQWTDPLLALVRDKAEDL
jgi:murein DD-endopeptidase MepM/ murein hydrolase activator NlpD